MEPINKTSATFKCRWKQTSWRLGGKERTLWTEEKLFLGLSYKWSHSEWKDDYPTLSTISLDCWAHQGLGSIPGQLTWDLLWTKWQRDGLLWVLWSSPGLIILAMFHVHSFIHLLLMLYRLSNWQCCEIIHLNTSSKGYVLLFHCPNF